MAPKGQFEFSIEEEPETETVDEELDWRAIRDADHGDCLVDEEKEERCL